jgi:hypothetical protein
VPSAAPGLRRRMPLYPRPRHGANPHHPSVTAVPEYLCDRATPTAGANSHWRACDTQAVREYTRGQRNSSAAFLWLWSLLRITYGESSKCTCFEAWTRRGRQSQLAMPCLVAPSREGSSRSCATWAARAALSTLEPRATGAKVLQSSPNPAVREWTSGGEVGGGNTKGRARLPGLSDPVAEFYYLLKTMRTTCTPPLSDWQGSDTVLISILLEMQSVLPSSGTTHTYQRPALA